MRTRLVLILPLILAALSARAEACSQCLCGMPFPADVLGGVVPNQLSYGLEERYLSKSNALEEAPGVEEEREHRVAAFGLWRAGNRIALLGRVPFNVKEITLKPTDEAETRETTRGIGDSELLLMAGLFQSTGPRPLMVGLVLGGTAPTGSSDKKGPDGERLDAHLQPGIGAWSGTAGVHVAVASSAGVWDLSLLGRASDINEHGYQYGSAALYNAGFITRAWRGAQLLAQVNGRAARRDRFEDGSPGENTGGTVTYLSPGLRWSGDLGLALEGAVQIPIAQSLYGDQTEHTTARFSLSIAR